MTSQSESTFNDMVGIRIRRRALPKTFRLFVIVGSNSHLEHSAVAQRCVAENKVVSFTFNVSRNRIVSSVFLSISAKLSASKASSACASITCSKKSYSLFHSPFFFFVSVNFENRFTFLELSLNILRQLQLVVFFLCICKLFNLQLSQS